jgi:hypothetical protein
VVAALVAATVIGALAACSQVLGINSDRHLAIDSGPGDMPETGPVDSGVEAAAPEAGPWDCVSEPPQTFPGGLMTAVRLVVPDSLQPILNGEQADGGSALTPVTYTPLVGEQVRACPSSYDNTCANSTAWQTTDEAGVANFLLPNSFGGYYQFNDPALFTTTFWPSQMLAGDTEATVAATMLPLSATNSLEALLNNIHLDHDSDGGLGHVLLSVYDCFDHSAPGVQFVPSASAPPGGQYTTLTFYTVGAGGAAMELPSTTATSTDNSGTGGILNVPAGLFSVKVLLASSGRQVGSTNVIVNPGVASSAILRVRTTRTQ